MDHVNSSVKSFPPLSTRSNSTMSGGRTKPKSKTVVPKQKRNSVKARKVSSPRTKLQRTTERRAKCMGSSTKLHEYFNRPKVGSGKPTSPICLSSDDGLPGEEETSPILGTPSGRSVFVDQEAECSDSDGPRQGTLDIEEEDPTMGGFIVSDGHLSGDESDDWAGIQYARRLATPERDEATPPRSPKEKQKEPQSPEYVNTWSPCGQPPSPPMSPVRLDEDTPLDEPMDDAEVEEDPQEELVEPGVDVDTTTGNFRMRNQYLLLTYKSHLPKQDYINWLRKQTDRPDAWIRLAHETGDKKCPYNHTHVVVDFVKPLNVKNCHKFCYNNPNIPNKKDKCGAIHPNIKKLLGPKPFVDAKVYIAKEDPENKDLRVSNNDDLEKGARIVERIHNSASVNVALRTNLRKISDAPGILQIFATRSLVQKQVEIPPRPDREWSVELLNQVENKECPTGDRKIIWYIGQGNDGKSHLAKYLSRTYRDESGFDWLCLTALDDEKEAFNQLLQAINSGFRYKGFIVDIARAYKYKKRLYSFLESFKNGHVTATKYQGGQIEFNTPWVIVMSNFWPKTKEMSTDRWDIRRIDPQTHKAEHLPWDAESPEDFKHCPTCQCCQPPARTRHDIVQERM